jgi:hypothetical protein
MSLSPSMPEQGLKKFWSRPEGKAGMIFLAGLAVVFFLYGLAPVLALAAMAMTSLFSMIVTGIACVGLLMLAFNSTVHSRIGLIFRLTMRFLTGLIINIDPIGILKDRLKEMRKRRAIMADQITNVNTQRVTLKSIIIKNAAEAQSNLGKAAEADRRLAGSAGDVDYQQRMQLQKNIASRHAERLKQSNVGYQTLLTKLDGIYTFLSKWAVNIDFFIEDTDDEVKQQEIQYKTLNAGFKAFKTAMSVVSGNADESDIYNETLERLADEASRKLSYMEESQKVAQKFMDSADLEQGSANMDAMADLDAYEQKFLTPGNPETSFLAPGAKQPERAPVTIEGKSTPTYQSVGSSDNSSPWKL